MCEFKQHSKRTILLLYFWFFLLLFECGCEGETKRKETKIDYNLELDLAKAEREDPFVGSPFVCSIHFNDISIFMLLVKFTLVSYLLHTHTHTNARSFQMRRKNVQSRVELL